MVLPEAWLILKSLNSGATAEECLREIKKNRKEAEKNNSEGYDVKEAVCIHIAKKI